MPTKKRHSRKRTNDKYKWIGHIEVYFNDDEIIRAIEYIAGREADFEDSISRISQQGTGVKFTYSGDQDTYRITLQPKDAHSTYRGYTLGFSHVDLGRLLLIGTYICEVMMANDQIELPESRDTNDW